MVKSHRIQKEELENNMKTDKKYRFFWTNLVQMPPRVYKRCFRKDSSTEKNSLSGQHLNDRLDQSIYPIPCSFQCLSMLQWRLKG